MSTIRPPDALVASMIMSESASAPATRMGGMATPVEVSLCGVQYASMPASATNAGAVPGSDLQMVGSPRKGAALTPLANFAPNSPKVRN